MPKSLTLPSARHQTASRQPRPIGAGRRVQVSTCRVVSKVMAGCPGATSAPAKTNIAALRRARLALVALTALAFPHHTPADASLTAGPPGVPEGRAGPPASSREETVDRPSRQSEEDLAPWRGFYLGGHVAYGLGSAASILSDSIPPASTNSFGSLYGGMQLGYSHAFPAKFVIGLEADVSFPNFLEDGLVSTSAGSQGSVTQTLDCVGTVRGRLGYILNRFLFYGTGGFAWSLSHFTDTPGALKGLDDVVRLNSGWTVGAGAEFALTRGWTIKLEYLYDQFAKNSLLFPSGVSTSSSVTMQSLRVGLNWWIPWPGDQGPAKSGDAEDSSPAASADTAERNWTVHGQATLVGQGYPGFHSPYEGTNSLSGENQFANTLSATAFLGVRLWEGGEFYVNPELMQGFGLSDVHGLAAFPNGEAQKSDFPIPRFNIARVFLSQTIGLGGESEWVEDGPNQIAKRRQISRITITAGKFATNDYFLINSYAGGPREEFLNWNIYGGGSYDQTMDKLSWTWGALVELNQREWALRAGYFLLPIVSNSNTFDTHIPGRGQYMAEGEVRYELFSKPGRALLTAWLNHGNMGSYSAALALPVTTPGYPDITLTRQERTNYGFVVGLEQALTSDLGIFSRASWSPGQVEIMGWTDCHASFSLGAALKGGPWGRGGDTLGLAAVIEGLSPIAREYFAAGGLGILIGDGRLHYRPEKAIEAYYAYDLVPEVVATLDYQLFADPGYNADRGPVSIFSVRLHVEF